MAAKEPVVLAHAFARLLEWYLHSLGQDNPCPLATRGNLAYWRGVAGDAVGAAEAFEELLEVHIQQLGPHHPDTVITRQYVDCWRARAAGQPP
ncbi:hypothetical protein [Streptomyces erythrochromogenes]|uniref:hypothetical protein n=1 Tax=Streptomyces erythrochromogenes TaxID=285574 RepID=UPI00368DC99A